MIQFTTDDIQKRDKLLMDWDNAKKHFDEAKEAEMALRKQVTDLCFPNPDKGTQRVELGQGYKLKLVHGVRYTIDKEMLPDALIQLASTEEGGFIADRLIKYTPELSVSEYNGLSETHRKIIDTVLTSKPASPVLEIEAPKEKKR